MKINMRNETQDDAVAKAIKSDEETEIRTLKRRSCASLALGFAGVLAMAPLYGHFKQSKRLYVTAREQPAYGEYSRLSEEVEGLKRISGYAGFIADITQAKKVKDLPFNIDSNTRSQLIERAYSEEKQAGELLNQNPDLKKIVKTGESGWRAARGLGALALAVVGVYTAIGGFCEAVENIQKIYKRRRKQKLT